MVDRKWLDGAWWLSFDATYRRGSKHVIGGPERSKLWLRYEDLCAAFPGFREIYTPEPDDPPQGLEEDQ